jgi:hypothetical protein
MFPRGVPENRYQAVRSNLENVTCCRDEISERCRSAIEIGGIMRQR